ncbi:MULTISPECIES: ABC transporter substrate-binding protein [unclassified Roseateles]|uniref:ABC transporter substrate-binding protein n=1 Tax=unclassified Roseateles TaxID=2626991 RepID=UPI0006FC4DB5|nr:MULTISPECIES: ABC transporter substrate-binding protein [unclassified Roseateles]KQW46549.1 bicyclomycin resistance protein [Pelomonas sp. Root405]KRA73600.1 bicyclomycin resistance protein [Pelomonas sp. Root662]
MKLPALLTGLLLACTLHGADAQEKVLRQSFKVAETGFDPAQITDLYSKNIAAAIFDAPLEYDFGARPFKLRPNTLVEMPEISADFKTITMRVKPGIYFADDPAFKGKKRELTAEDYVYSVKRHYDPQWKSGNLYLLENVKIAGLSELRTELMKAKKPFDYDRPVEGLKALDRYTFQIKLGVADPRFVYQFSDAGFLGAVAREVVEFYGDKIMEHPVGTNAWRLGEWRRSSRIVLEKNPNFRDVRYAEVAPPDASEQLKAEVAALQGRKLPMLDRVVIDIIEEAQPRWLSFLNGEAEMIEEVPIDFSSIAMPGNKLAPNLAKRGITMTRYPRSDISLSYYNMEDPVIGGYTPEKVALRRAINLAVDLDKEIRLVRRGQALKSQSPVPTVAFGYDANFKSENSEYNLPKAKALLDMYGYKDVDGDGYRELPDGKPLLIEYSTLADGERRQLAEQWKKNMDALGVNMTFKIGKFPEQLKAANAGKLQMWGVGWVGTTPDGDTFLALGSGKAKGKANKPRFDLPAFEALYEKQKTLPDGPERAALMLDAQRLLVAYAPYKFHVHRIWTDMAHPWVRGYSRNIFVRDYWKYVDIDTAALPKSK